MRVKKNQLLHVLKLNSELNAIKDKDVLLERILTEVRIALNADAGSIYVREQDQLTIHYAQNTTLESKLPPGHKLPYKVVKVPINKKSISGYAAYTGEVVNIKDVYHIPASEPYTHNKAYDELSGYKSVSNLTIPLVNNTGTVLGVLQVINAKNQEGKVTAFSKDDVILGTNFATNASMALERAQMTRTMILRMIKMAELRDPKETGAHVNRVAGFSVEIYERWAHKHYIPHDEIQKTKDNLRIAAMLHDVGKVSISDLILKKPDRFTNEEYDIMKTHTLQGARLFSEGNSDLDALARIIALNHHENWDGTGYPGWIDPETNTPIKTNSNGLPLGKKGDEIPLFARIVSLADVYDALRSTRVYKKSWEEEDVVNEIIKLSGVKFDPELVDIFTEAHTSLQGIATKYNDL
ncbi:HD family phosphohydrolase [Spirochaeta cellobiosiphila]|uniref:HD family phosphohydrolase n=1 Tax=Spirochaeta cellobiosiphila TaxID=504483 RepID=UPI000413CD64|nr:HD family phosphohydrolase [Spirochaeta cellobiosiphila]